MEHSHDLNAFVIVCVYDDVREPGNDKFPRTVNLTNTT